MTQIGALDLPEPENEADRGVWGIKLNAAIGQIVDAHNETDGRVGAEYPPAGGVPKSDLSSSVQASLGKADSALQSIPSTYTTDDELAAAIAALTFYTKPVGGIPSTDLDSAAQAALAAAGTALQAVPSEYVTDDELATALADQLTGIRQVPAYSGSNDGQFLGVSSGALEWTTPAGGGSYPPAGGVQYSDLASGVQDSLDAADTAVQPADLSGYATTSALDAAIGPLYTKPETGIPDTDLTTAIRASLGLADTALQPGALDDYATAADSEAYVASQLANYATTAAVNTAIDAITPATIGAQPEGSYALAADLDNTYAIATAAIPATEKGADGGVATLDGSGLLPVAQLPAIAVVDFLGTVASQSAMLATAGQKGDWVIRSDRGTVFTITGTDPTQLSSWQELSYPTAPVSSVAGRTGAVTLAKADVGLGNVDNTADTAKPVSTAQQAALDLKAPLASPTFTGTVSGVSKAMVGLSNVDNTSDANKPVSTAQQTALDGKAAVSHTHTASQISDSTTVGRNVLTAADAAAARSAIGAGTSSLAIGTTGSTAKAGNYAPASTDISDSTTVGRAALTASDATALRTAAKIVQITASAYAALGSKDSATLYLIVG